MQDGLKEGRSIAVVVGVDAYKDGVPPLQNAASDARELHRVVDRYHGYRVTSLIDEQATADSLLSTLRALHEGSEPLGPDDRLLVYFAGHGVALDDETGVGPTGYILLSDAQLAVPGTYLSMGAIYTELAALPCRHLLLILDCCFAGVFRWATTRSVREYWPTNQPLYAPVYERFLQSYAWQVITSTSHDQMALDVGLRPGLGVRLDAAGHSPFAQALCHALEQGDADLSRPPDGVITATELYLYLRHAVELLTTERGHTQTPTLWPLRKHDKGEYIFLVPGRKPNLWPPPPPDPDQNPYRGLRPYREADHELFFGRESVTGELRSTVERHALTIVLGPSGVGKSSLVVAGLLPLLKTEGWNSLGTINPGAAPLGALATILSEVPGIRLAERIARRNALAGAWPAILVVDHFEELITNAGNELERKEFLSQIVEALGEHVGRLHVVVTLRSDFEAQFALPPSPVAPVWATAGRFIVPPMQPHELREVIERPAAVRALFFESDNLVSRLAAEVTHAPGALPLLSFALAALYDLYIEHARKGDEQGVRRIFSEQDYKRLGGVTTALAKRANQQYGALDPLTQQTMKRLMLRMVSLEGDEPIRRRVLLDELDYEDSAEQQRVDIVIREFVSARLLVVGVDTIKRVYVEPAHDALIYGWQMLWDLISAGKDLIMLQRRLNQGAVNWSHSGRRHADLWSNSPQLTSLERLLHTGDNWLNRLEAQFVRRSARQRSINRRLRLIATLVLLSLAIAAGIVLQLQRLETQRQARQAEQADRITEASRLSTEARAALNEFPQRSLLLAVEALTITMGIGERPLPAAEESLREALAFTGGRPVPGLHTVVNQVASSRDARWLLSADGDHKIRLWDLAAPRPQASPRVLLSGYKGLPAGNFSLDGNWLAMSDAKSNVYLWNLRLPDGPGNPLILPDENRKIDSVKLSPDLHWLVATHEDSSISLWNLDNITTVTKPRALVGHTDWVSAVSFSSDGRWLATSSSDETIRLWDLHASDPSTAPVILRVPGERLGYTAFSPDNKWLIGRSIDVICLWSLSGDGLSPHAQILPADWEELFDGPPPIFSRDGRWLIIGSRPAKVRLLDLRAPNATGSAVVLGENEGLINAMALSNDGRWLATAGTDRMVRLWNLNAAPTITEPVVLEGHTAEVTALAVSPDGHWLITGSSDHTARVWDLTGSNPAADGIVLHGHEDRIATVAVASDSRRLVVSTYRTARIWDLAALDPPEPRLLRGHTDRVSSVVTGSDGEWLASGSADGTVVLWRPVGPDQQVISTTLRGHQDGVRALSLSTDGRWLATGSADRTIRLWDLQSPDLAASQVLSSDSGITGVVFSPDTRWLAASDELQMVHIWRLAEGESDAAPIHFPDQTNILAPVVHGPTLAFSPDSHLFARLKNNDAAALYDLTAIDPAATERELVGHSSTSFAIAFSFDSQRLATGNNDRTARLWEITTYDDTVNSVVLSGHEDTVNIVTFSPDNHWLATGSVDQTIRLWNLQLADAAAGPVVLRGHAAAISAALFTPDNHWLITGSADGIVRTWDVSSNDFAGSSTVLQAHTTGIIALAVSSDSHWLVTAADEPTIRLWNLRLDELMELACSRAGRNLTAAEWQQYMGQTPYRETCP